MWNCYSCDHCPKISGSRAMLSPAEASPHIDPWPRAIHARSNINPNPWSITVVAEIPNVWWKVIAGIVIRRIIGRRWVDVASRVRHGSGTVATRGRWLRVVLLSDRQKRLLALLCGYCNGFLETERQYCFRVYFGGPPARGQDPGYTSCGANGGSDCSSCSSACNGTDDRADSGRGSDFCDITFPRCSGEDLHQFRVNRDLLAIYQGQFTQFHRQSGNALDAAGILGNRNSAFRHLPSPSRNPALGDDRLIQDRRKRIPGFVSIARQQLRVSNCDQGPNRQGQLRGHRHTWRYVLGIHRPTRWRLTGCLAARSGWLAGLALSGRKRQTAYSQY